MADIIFQPRYQPCILLHKNSIPCSIWFEDVLVYYGVPTATFELYLIVPDIDQAAEVLAQCGWTLLTAAPAKVGTAVVDTQQRRLVPPMFKTKPYQPPQKTSIPPPPSQDPPRATETVLLPANDWNFTFSEAKHRPGNLGLFPDLPEFLDALIDSLLDTSLDQSMLWGHIACQIVYLYGYNSTIQDRSFAEHLRYEHRQYHLDSLSGMRTGTAHFIKHQRKIREALNQGSFTLCECSASRDREDLFPERRERELLRKMMERSENYEVGGGADGDSNNSGGSGSSRALDRLLCH